jgi:hypothetical protein
MRRYWWVNQNQTFKQEYGGGYLWSPKFKRGGARNPFYDFMRIVAPGDLVLSFYKQRIAALGVADSFCYEAPKPEEFGSAGANWSDIGWRVDVVFRQLERQIRPADHMQSLRSLLPAKYSPLLPDGRGLQSAYLTELPASLMGQLALLIGTPVIDFLDHPPSIVHDPAREDNPVQERWERDIVSDIERLAGVSKTQREQLIDARVGQGTFRSRVYERERACRVTRVDRPEHLIASHIKPWRHSDNEQRLDPENGLMLTPNIDHLFDRGFITFRDNGNLIYSPAAHRESLLRMGLDPDQKLGVGDFTSIQREYLEFHRDEIFLGMTTAS